jgi:hypothetical protein
MPLFAVTFTKEFTSYVKGESLDEVENALGVLPDRDIDDLGPADVSWSIEARPVSLTVPVKVQAVVTSDGDVVDAREYSKNLEAGLTKPRDGK